MILFSASVLFTILNIVDRANNDAWVFNAIGWAAVALVFLGDVLK